MKLTIFSLLRSRTLSEKMVGAMKESKKCSIMLWVENPPITNTEQKKILGKKKA